MKSINQEKIQGYSLNDVGNMKLKKTVMICLFSILLLVGCTNQEVNVSGKSAHWSVSVVNNISTKEVTYSIKYIGDETKLNNIYYEFIGGYVDAKGGDDREYIPPFEINQRVYNIDIKLN